MDRTRQIDVISGPQGEGNLGYIDPLKDRQFLIFAVMIDRPLGDFLCRTYYAATVKLNIPKSMLVAYVRNDRPYKEDILAINPYIDRVISMASNSYLPIDAFYAQADREKIPGTDEFINTGYAWPDLVLAPSMMRLNDLVRFSHLPTLSIPTKRRPEIEARLVQLGLDPTKWYCCIYYRQPNYEYRPAIPSRDVDDGPFEALTNWIIDDLGGQVVRLGHPEMRRFPERRGFVDLSILNNEFILQAAAVSRARFMIATPAGPAQLPPFFGVPFAMTNAISMLGTWDRDHLLLPRHIVTSEGRRIDIRSMIRKSAWDDQTVKELLLNKGCRLVDNSFEELREVTVMLHERTAGVEAWRPAPERTSVVGAGSIEFPNSCKRECSLVQFPGLTPFVAK